jgi:hypothetical protein
MLLALGVGVLVGDRACNDPIVANEPVVETVVEERVVYECPPAGVTKQDAGVAEARPPAAEKPPVPARPAAGSTNEQLPDAPPPASPAERRRLMDWVSEQSRGLSNCTAGAGGQTLRTTVTLHLDESGAVKRVEIVDPSGDIDATTERCLRREMQGWEPPTGLVTGRNRLIFGLVI